MKTGMPFFKISPRKTSDKGGYITMPLKENIPEPKDRSWKSSVCPRCGRPCWDKPLPAGYSEDQFDGKYCTLCALMLMAAGRK